MDLVNNIFIPILLIIKCFSREESTGNPLKYVNNINGQPFILILFIEMVN
jgi:hypothetical protein